jgi:orotidine-5'-phosphate decarboxylase
LREKNTPTTTTYGIQGGEEAVKAEAERYREEGWKAYEERLGRE